MTFEDVPKELRDVRQWVNRTGPDGKAPCTSAGKMSEWEYPENWAGFDEVVESSPRHAGIGFIVQADEARGDKQIIAIDFDECRNPAEGGKPDEWALNWLNKLNSFTQLSKSGTGYHVWIFGKLPDGIASMQSTGCDPAMSGLSAAAWQFIRAMKPKSTAANRIEIYQGLGIKNGIAKDRGAHHIAMTESRVVEYSQHVEHRQDILDELLKECNLNDEPKSDWLKQMESDGMASRRLPKLDIMKVWGDVADLHDEGGQLAGSMPEIGSTTGHNLLINLDTQVWCCMHNGINKGGDSWVGVAYRSGALRIEDCGPGCLKDRNILEKTIAYALDKKWVSPDDVQIRAPTLAAISLDDDIGKIGVDPTDGAIKQLIEIEINKIKQKELVWISDWSVHVHTETREIRNGIETTEYKMVGCGARDHIRREFIVSASDVQKRDTFVSACENAFGCANRRGKINWEMVKSLSYYPIRQKRITVPMWQDGKPLVPGLGLVNGIEFKLSQITPALVHDGDIKMAIEALQKLLNCRKFSTILATVILGAPIYARWFKNDRFGLALWAQTGTQKTTIAKLCTSVYGMGYNDEISLVKHGTSSSTVYAEGEAMANAGILPRIIDNVKATDEREIQRYISLIQSTIEGGEKLQGKKDKGLRDITNYLTTPIITGEVRPSEASTSARVLNLSWQTGDLNKLAEAQKMAEFMPTIGYHWLLYLAGIDIDRDEITEAKTAKAIEFLQAGIVNPGRLANIYCLLKATWSLMERSPLGDAIKPFRDQFIAELDEAIQEQGNKVSDESDLNRFLDGVSRLQASQSDHFMIGELANQQPIYGRENEHGLFLNPGEVLQALKRINTFSQIPTIDSITWQLKNAGLLVQQSGRRMYRTRLNGIQMNGWMLKPGWSEPMNPVGSECGSDKQQRPPSEPKNQSTDENEERVLREKKDKQNSKLYIDGSDGSDGSIDIDIDNTVTVPHNLGRVQNQTQTNQNHKPKEEKKSIAAIEVRFLVDHSTQIYDAENEMHQFTYEKGQCYKVPGDRAKIWMEKGIAEEIKQ